MIQCIHAVAGAYGDTCSYNVGCPHQMPAAWGLSCGYAGEEALPAQWRVQPLTYPVCTNCGSEVTEGCICPSCGESI